MNTRERATWRPGIPASQRRSRRVQAVKNLLTFGARVRAPHVSGRRYRVAMGNRTGIEWTEATWNPTTGCDKVSPGCDNCYALTLAKRLKAMGNSKYQIDGDPRTSGEGFALQEHARSLDVPRSWISPRLVFVNSMSDLFHPRVTNTFIESVFRVMQETPRHTYQLLTKRPKRALKMRNMLPWPENVWMGVSVESSEYLWRLGVLRDIPSQTRFISAEPLLGPLDEIDLSGISWLIAGGESGVGHRSLNPEWVLALRDACRSQDVAFFFKQWGGRTPKAGGRSLEGRTWDDMPLLLEGSTAN